MDEVWVVERREEGSDNWHLYGFAYSPEDAEKKRAEWSRGDALNIVWHYIYRIRRYIPAPEPEVGPWKGGDDERIEGE